MSKPHDLHSLTLTLAYGGCLVAKWLKHWAADPGSGPTGNRNFFSSGSQGNQFKQALAFCRPLLAIIVVNPSGTIKTKENEDLCGTC